MTKGEITPRERYLVILIFIGALAVRCFRITDPFWGIESFTSAQFAIFARNFIRYGYLATHFAYVNNVGEIPGLRFYYYMHHPPLFSLIVSLVYRAFGVSEWGARAVAVILSMGGMVLLYCLAEKIWNGRVALFVALFYAFSPLEAYFGRSTVYEMMVLPFVLGTLWFYIRWVETGEGRHLGYAILTFIPGGLIDWTAYFILPAIFIHHLFFVRKGARGSIGKAFLLPLTGLVLFGLLYLYTSILEGSFFEHNALAESFFFWTRPSSGESFALVPFMRTEILRFYYLLTPVVLLFSLLWVIHFAFNLLKRDLAKDSYIILLVLYGLFPTFLLWKETIGHQWLICYLSPAMLLSAGVGADRLSRVKLAGGWAARGVVLVLTAMFLYLSYSPLRRLFIEIPLHSPNRYAVEVGKYIHRLTSPDERVLLLTSMGGGGGKEEGVEHFRYFPEKFYSKPSPVVRFYADRFIQWGVEKDDDLLSLNQEEPGYFRYLIIGRQYEEAMEKSILARLEDRYPAQREGLFTLYDLSAPPVNPGSPMP